MGILDNAVRSAVPGGSVAKPLMIALLGLLASGALFKGGGGQSTAAKPPQNPADEAGGLLGGLGGLLERFQQGPHGNLLKSWIGTGENQSIWLIRGRADVAVVKSSTRRGRQTDGQCREFG